MHTSDFKYIPKYYTCMHNLYHHSTFVDLNKIVFDVKIKVIPKKSEC